PRALPNRKRMVRLRQGCPGNSTLEACCPSWPLEEPPAGASGRQTVEHLLPVPFRRGNLSPRTLQPPPPKFLLPWLWRTSPSEGTGCSGLAGGQPAVLQTISNVERETPPARRMGNMASLRFLHPKRNRSPSPSRGCLLPLAMVDSFGA